MINIQCASKNKTIPTKAQIKKWLQATLKNKTAEITVRIVNNKESMQLNNAYRKKNYPTNVLSFVYSTKPVQGDMVLCAPLIAKEATAQKKSLQHHWAHLVVHGCLHLLGFDHMTTKERTVMEKKEIAILKNLHFRNPYEQ